MKLLLACAAAALVAVEREFEAIIGVERLERAVADLDIEHRGFQERRFYKSSRYASVSMLPAPSRTIISTRLRAPVDATVPSPMMR